MQYTTQTYTQPQPAYTTGNADALTGGLEPYDRPGKTNLFRTYVFYLQPSKKNADDFWNTVIDPVWLANSSDPDAEALRSASNGSVPWRLLYRVTYSERFRPHGRLRSLRSSRRRVALLPGLRHEREHDR